MKARHTVMMHKNKDTFWQVSLIVLSFTTPASAENRTNFSAATPSCFILEFRKASSLHTPTILE